ncbi:hypothetical protein [Clostridium celatum]|nr:hypothetical protein [Clostridium celatum]
MVDCDKEGRWLNMETGYELIYLGNGEVDFIRFFDEFEEEK